MEYQVQFEQWVPFPVDHVFAFFANPNNLPRIMPPAIETKIVLLELKPPPPDHSALATMARSLAGSGSKIVTSFRVFPFLPIPVQWISYITEFEWNHHFADIQEKGPFKTWHHRHQFATVTRNGVNGTIVRDLIEYEVGFGFLGAIAQNLFVRHQIQQTFAYRQNILQSLLQP
jgi:ligand-binding SRPBCC domain-containing protein